MAMQVMRNIFGTPSKRQHGKENVPPEFSPTSGRVRRERSHERLDAASRHTSFTSAQDPSDARPAGAVAAAAAEKAARAAQDAQAAQTAQAAHTTQAEQVAQAALMAAAAATAPALEAGGALTHSQLTESSKLDLLINQVGQFIKMHTTLSERIDKLEPLAAQVQDLQPLVGQVQALQPLLTQVQDLQTTVAAQALQIKELQQTAAPPAGPSMPPPPAAHPHALAGTTYARIISEARSEDIKKIRNNIKIFPVQEVKSDATKKTRFAEQYDTVKLTELLGRTCEVLEKPNLGKGVLSYTIGFATFKDKLAAMEYSRRQHLRAAHGMVLREQLLPAEVTEQKILADAMTALNHEFRLPAHTQPDKRPRFTAGWRRMEIAVKDASTGMEVRFTRENLPDIPPYVADTSVPGSDKARPQISLAYRKACFEMAMALLRSAAEQPSRISAANRTPLGSQVRGKQPLVPAAAAPPASTAAVVPPAATVAPASAGAGASGSAASQQAPEVVMADA